MVSLVAPPVPAPFYYNAKIIEWHDGDTVRVLADRGMRDYSEWSIRLLGVALLELSEPGGKEAREELTRRLPPGSPVVLATVKPDKYGDRKDALLFYRDSDGVHDLAADLIADGWAAPWNGSGKQPKPPWPRPN